MRDFFGCAAYFLKICIVGPRYRRYAFAISILMKDHSQHEFILYTNEPFGDVYELLTAAETNGEVRVRSGLLVYK